MAEPDGKSIILVVDDTAENIERLSALLRPEYRVKAALSDETALALPVNVSGLPPNLKAMKPVCTLFV